MQLLRHIGAKDGLFELADGTSVRQAQIYAARGWVVLYRTRRSKGRDTYGHQNVFAMITSSGREALSCREAG